MSPQVCHLDELSVAVCAGVWLLSRVESHVSLEVVIPCKSFMAFLTFERFLPRVCSLVVLQHVLVAEGPVADVAGEHLLSPVLTPVPPPPGRWTAGGGRAGHGLGGLWGRDVPHGVKVWVARPSGGYTGEVGRGVGHGGGRGGVARGDLVTAGAGAAPQTGGQHWLVSLRVR